MGYISAAYGGLTAAVVLTVYVAAASKLRDVTPCVVNEGLCEFIAGGKGIVSMSISDPKG